MSKSTKPCPIWAKFGSCVKGGDCKGSHLPSDLPHGVSPSLVSLTTNTLIVNVLNELKELKQATVLKPEDQPKATTVHNHLNKIEHLVVDLSERMSVVEANVMKLVTLMDRAGIDTSGSGFSKDSTPVETMEYRSKVHQARKKPTITGKPVTGLGRKEKELWREYSGQISEAEKLQCSPLIPVVDPVASKDPGLKSLTFERSVPQNQDLQTPCIEEEPSGDNIDNLQGLVTPACFSDEDDGDLYSCDSGTHREHEPLSVSPRQLGQPTIAEENKNPTEVDISAEPSAAADNSHMG